MKRHLIRLPLLSATILTTILFLFGNTASAGKLTFHFNDDVTADSVFTFTTDIDTLWITFPNPARENYELMGWYEDAALTEGPLTPGATYYVPNNASTAAFFNSDHDFYAKWKEVIPPPTGSYKKLGLIERFTNTGCSPCVSYNKAGYTQWITTHKKDVAVIHYHVSWPSSSDPMYQYNKDLPTYMFWTNYGSILAPGGQGGVPAVATEGKLLKGASTPSNAAFDSWKAEMDTTTSPVRIVPTIHVSSGVVTITNDVMSEMAFTGAKLYTMLIEDSVMYNDPYNEKIFPNVARYAFPNNSPFETLTITAGQSITRSYTYDVGTLNKTHLRVVSYLKTSDDIILNAGQAFVGDAEPQTVTISTSSNPAEGGTITISPDNVVEVGTEVTLTATANSGWKFVNWATTGSNILSTNPSYTFTVTGDVNFITANFEPDNAILDNSQRLVKVNFDGDRVLQLLLPEDMVVRELQLVDVLGFCRYQTTNIQQHVELPLLPSGTYWLLLRHSKGIESHSIIKVK